MKTIHNPFITRGYIPDECFCGRVSETQRLAKSLMNGNDVVLFSPRRMGKTGLITHVFEREEIKRSYYTFFVDILHTTVHFLFGQGSVQGVTACRKKSP